MKDMNTTIMNYELCRGEQTEKCGNKHSNDQQNLFGDRPDPDEHERQLIH